MDDSQHKFLLNFRDKALESAFCSHHEVYLRGTLRQGLLSSLIMWGVVMLLLGFFVPPNQAGFAQLAILVLVCVPLALFLYATYRNYNGWYHLLAALSNIIAGIMNIYLCTLVVMGAYIMFPVLLVLLIFAFFIYKIRMLLGIFTVTCYIMGFQLSLHYFHSLPENEHLIISYLVWLFLLFAIVAGYYNEKSERERFVYRYKLEESKKIIEVERAKSDSLLANMLPSYIADRLKKGTGLIADFCPNATVLFADIVGFTELSQQLPPQDLVLLLNHIFSAFDRFSNDFNLEKIKTIGDAYMVAGGIDSHTGGESNVANFALKIVEFIKTDEQCKKYGLRIRVGIHIGPVVAGVIGVKRLFYDLWGDTVNIASRMESHGEQGRIAVSEAFKESLSGSFQYEERGPINVKGKGVMKTYFLESKIA